MNLKDILHDAGRYTCSDWTKLLLLGFTLLLLDLSNESASYGLKSHIFDYIFLVSGSILALVEGGYAFRIVEETIKGSTEPPHFNRFYELLVHGLKHWIMIVTYAIFPSIIIIIGVLFAVVDSDIGALIVILGFILTFPFTIQWMGALLNMAHNHGSLKSAYHFRTIYKRIRLIGLKRLTVAYVGIFLVASIITVTLRDSMSSTIPIFGIFIFQLILAPFILIYTTRILGLVDKPLN
ncbi:MAG: DUF4013 domain-containing protein [Methanobacteriaceae archaeon]|nr:MAG: hypothetical protein CIT01_05645 [Methanobacterium sp. BRmetb2]MCC7557586.1 DUF4013 domain-containing protein [Methanobacteriaceae archaeon]